MSSGSAESVRRLMSGGLKGLIERQREFLPYHTGTRTQVRGRQHPHTFTQILCTFIINTNTLTKINTDVTFLAKSSQMGHIQMLSEKNMLRLKTVLINFDLYSQRKTNNPTVIILSS